MKSHNSTYPPFVAPVMLTSFTFWSSMVELYVLNLGFAYLCKIFKFCAAKNEIFMSERRPAAPEKGGETPLKKKNLDNQGHLWSWAAFWSTKTLRKAVLQTKAKFLWSTRHSSLFLLKKRKKTMLQQDQLLSVSSLKKKKSRWLLFSTKPYDLSTGFALKHRAI